MTKSCRFWLGMAFAAYAVAILGLVGWSADAGSGTVVAAELALAGAFAIVIALILSIVLFRPLRRLAVQIRALAHESPDAIGLPELTAPVPELTQALADLARRHRVARAESDALIARSRHALEDERNRLAALLNDLHEGVIVCNQRHQMVLYNRVALRLLHVAGEIGLGRPLSGLLAAEPVTYALSVLARGVEDAKATLPFLTATSDGRALLQGRIGLVHGPAGLGGYVLTFSDVTEALNAVGGRDALLRELIDGLRDLEGGKAVAALLTHAEAGYRRLLGGWWPMADLRSVDLFDILSQRLAETGLTAVAVGLPLWLRGDGLSLSLALEALVRAVAASTGVGAFDLKTRGEAARAWIGLEWRGPAVDETTLGAWQAAPLSPLLGGMTVLDVLSHHTREPLLEEAAGDTVSLWIALAAGIEPERGMAPLLPSRPEFFDFELLEGRAAGVLADVRLRDLTYVVFDTETTGLNPRQGDEVVSIAGVRVVNGRILSGETFERIVNPGRPIPPESVVYHGITDEMVTDKPPLPVVLRQFKDFAADAVLVAHNAAFDLKFIRMKEAVAGVRFDNRVLDTMLLSSFVDGTEERQSLDAIAARYGVPVHDRHTALGDSLTAAAILLRLIDALDSKGIQTLGEAMGSIDMALAIHNRGLSLG